MQRFQGRHVVVTGGTGALGSAVVGRLIGEGATCHVPCMDESELKRFAHAGHERVKVTRGVDLSGEEAVARFYSALPACWASIHVAGGFAMSPLVETGLADFSRQMSMNAVTCFLCCREAAKRMIGGGTGAGGRIVNVAARPALEPRMGGGMAAYTASKAAVSALTEAIGEELAGSGVLVNAVVPSIMDTPANRAAMPQADHSKWASVDDVAATIAFLASPDNTCTRSALVPVYGRS